MLRRVFLAAALFAAAQLAAAPALAQTPDANALAVSTPEAHGFDAERIASLPAYLAEKAPRIRAVAIVRSGHLVFEYTRAGLRPEDTHAVNSVTKSVIATLAGIALDMGLIKSLDQKLAEFIAEAAAPGLDPRVKDITLRHVLTMTMGFDNESDRVPVHTVDALDALKRPMAAAPGEVFNYDNQGSHLMSVVLSRATGMSAARFAEAHLFGPLGITKYDWPSDAGGHSLGAARLRMTIKDMAKLGELYLKRGNWRSRQIVSAEFIAAATRRQSAGGKPVDLPYGFFWWLAKTPQSGHAPFASGYGGQIIYFVPALELVIAIATTPDMRGGQNAFVREIVLPAVRR